jgi:hypothetical protein
VLQVQISSLYESFPIHSDVGGTLSTTCWYLPHLAPHDLAKITPVLRLEPWRAKTSLYRMYFVPDFALHTWSRVPNGLPGPEL